MSVNPLVIIGSGVAGYTLAEEFRRDQPDYPIVMITRNNGALYSKPGLSTVFQLQRSPDNLITTSGEEMAKRLNLTLLADTEVTRIDAEKSLVYFNHQTLGYSKLVLALGASPRKFSYPNLPMVSINELSHYQTFRNLLEGKRKVLILGSGLVGCEFANDLTLGGYEVMVVTRDHYPLQKFIPKKVGEALQNALEKLGVKFYFQAHYESFLERVNPTETMIISALGLQPEISLAKAAGIHTREGIIVDEYLETNLPNIYALGDCAEVNGKCYWYINPAQLSAKALAKTLQGSRTKVEFALMRVKVKTPAYPIIFAGKLAPTSNTWKIEASSEGLCCTFYENGIYTGLILTGEQVKKFNEFPKPRI